MDNPAAPATPSLTDWSADLARRRSALDTQRATLSAEEVQNAKQGAAQFTPALDEYSKAVSQPAPVAQHATLPDPPPIAAKEYESLSHALIGLALIGGAKSHSNWLGVSSALNGAVKGWHEGNEQNAKTAYEDYQAKFASAKAHEDQFNRQYGEAVADRKLTINEKLKKIELIAAQQGRQDVLMAAKTRSLDAVQKQIDAGVTAIARLTQQQQQTEDRLGLQRDAVETRRSIAMAAQARSALTPEGAALLADITARTGTTPPLFGGRAQVFNQMAAEGVTGAEVASNKARYGSLLSSTTMVARREAALEQITQSVQALEPKVLALGRKIGLSDTTLINTPVNAVASRLGAQDLQEFKVMLFAVNREYMRAVTAPQSQGQLHVAAQQAADDMLHSNMGFGQLLGAFKAINTDIEAGRVASSNTLKMLDIRLRQNGMQYDTGATAAPAAPSVPQGKATAQYATNPKTGQRAISMDGGQTWTVLAPGAQVP